MFAAGPAVWRSGRAYGLMILVMLLGLQACSRAPPNHQAYIWQRLWTPAVVEAMSAQSAAFGGWRVLALQVVGVHLIAAEPDLTALARSAKPVRLVVRIEGARSALAVPALLAELGPLIARWRRAGVPLVGVEIDHDCATAALADYATWLRALRGALGADLSLSITALPTWLDSADLDAVLSAVDESVLQVHAVERPDRALFDSRRARDWTRRYAERAPHPYWVALPAYGVRVASSADGQVLAVDAEGEFDRSGAAGRELRADPVQVADFLAQLGADAPSLLQGYLWFRLPLAGDRRAWSAVTLNAVIAGQPLVAHFVVSARRAPGGAFDLSIRNDGTLDAAAPAILLPATCRLADALGRYRLHTGTSGLLLQPSGDVWLAVGEAERAGWARCETALAQEWRVR